MHFNHKLQLRTLIRHLISEVHDLSDKVNPEEITSVCMIAVAEYVGANEPFVYEHYRGQLDPFCRRWSRLYRMWPHLGDRSLEELERSVTSRDFFSASKSLSALETMLQDNFSSIGNHMIVTFSGWGFDPIEYLHAGLNVAELSQEDERFIKDIIHDFVGQEEVIVLKADKMQRIQMNP